MAVVLAIVLPIVLSKSASPDNPPHPTPLPLGIIYNPYNITYINDFGYSYEGLLSATEEYNVDSHLAAYESMTTLSADSLEPLHNMTTYPHMFPVGINNKFLNNLTYQFYMTDYKIASLLITDPVNARYSIPSDTVKKPNLNS